MADDNKLLNQTISDMFQKNDLHSHAEKKKTQGGRAAKKKAAQREFELALSVILVDLATSDQHFDQREYQVLSRGLSRLFNTNKCDVEGLVNEAKQVISGLRGTAKYAQLLKDSLDEEKKNIVRGLIDEIIGADGVEDGYETYLRHKYYDLLGISEEQAAPETVKDPGEW